VSRGLDWDRDGRDWPNRAASRFVTVEGIDWHVQIAGQGPAVWLIHGTGAATHSWRDVVPLLAERFSVVAMDLPGHGFTRGRSVGGLTLGGMARSLAALASKIGSVPAVIGAHSAGAAIAARMALDGSHRAPIVAFGPALLPFAGASAPLLSGLARLLFVNPLVPSLFARVARVEGQTERFLVRSTGSRIDGRGVDLYGRLFASPDHCAGAIEMMADWDLAGLVRQLPTLPVPMHIAHGDRDSAILPDDARRAAALAKAEFTLLSGLGHLAHEERPKMAAEMIADMMQGSGR
jgi:magnesium chelatase accessory protein